MNVIGILLMCLVFCPGSAWAGHPEGDVSSPIAPKELRSEQISVGAFTSAEKQFAIYRRILARTGRRVSEVKLGGENGFGHLFGMSFNHYAERDISCPWEMQEVSIGVFEDIDQKMSKILSLRQISDDQLMDAEIIGTKATGRIASIRLYYCK